MPDETNPIVTDPSDLELEPEGGSLDVATSADLPKGEALTLEELNQIAGRKFTDKGEAVKFVENLKGLVGDQAIAEARRKAKEFDALYPRHEALIKTYAKENEISEVEARNDIEKLLASSGISTQPAESGVMEEVKSLKAEIIRDKFLREHPEVSSYMDVIEAVSEKKGLSFNEVIKDTAVAKLLKSESGTVTTEPNKRIEVPQQNLNEVIANASKPNASTESKEALVRALGVAK